MKKMLFVFLLSPVFSIAQLLEIGESMNSGSQIAANGIQREEIYIFKKAYDSLLYRENLYDSCGYLVHSQTFSNSGKLVHRDSYFYDDDHLLVRKERSPYSGIIEKIFWYKYDAKRNIISISQYNDKDSLMSVETNDYTADGKILSTSIKKGGNISILRQLAYNSNNQMIKEAVCNGGKDSCINYLCEYNENGMVIRNYIEALSTKFSTENFYDSIGNIAQKKYLMFEGNKKLRHYVDDVFTYYPNSSLFNERIRTRDKVIIEKLKCYYTRFQSVADAEY